MTTWVEHQQRRVTNEEKNIPWFVGDKLKAYDVAKRVGVKTPEQYAVFRSASDFDPDIAPDFFVCKPLGLHSTHGVMVLRKDGEGKFYDFLRKRELTTDAIIKEQVGWYEKSKYKGSYRLIFEELLIPEGGEPGVIPFDYKFYTFRDKVGMISQIDRNSPPPRLSWFKPDFSHFEVDENVESDWKVVQRGEPVLPKCAEELLESARRVSASLNTPFASIDMFATTRGAVLGEITLAPGGPFHGVMYRFKPHFNEHLGEMWDQAKAELIAEGFTF